MCGSDLPDARRFDARPEDIRHRYFLELGKNRVHGLIEAR